MADWAEQSRAELGGLPRKRQHLMGGPKFPKGQGLFLREDCRSHTERCSEPSLQGEGRACRGRGHVEVLMQTCLGFP